jgi:predicted SprT family Zn-dependent metalloprotease
MRSVRCTEDFERAIGPTSLRALHRRLSTAAKSWDGYGSQARVTVDFNPRLRTKIARFLPDQDRIEVGPRFVELRRRRGEILVHELAHAAVRSLHGAQAKPHGKEWQSLMRQAGLEPKSVLRVSLSASARVPTVFTERYVHTCPVCQIQITARKPNRAWKCRACVGAGLEGDLVIHRKVAR